jgi:hypothetical protein
VRRLGPCLFHTRWVSAPPPASVSLRTKSSRLRFYWLLRVFDLFLSCFWFFLARRCWFPHESENAPGDSFIGSVFLPRPCRQAICVFARALLRFITQFFRVVKDSWYGLLQVARVKATNFSSSSSLLRVHVCAHQVLDKMLELCCRFRS